MTRRVVHIGSCLTGMTAALLVADHKWQRVADIDLQRSDLFCDHFIHRSAVLPPRDYLEELLAFDQDHGRDGRHAFERMYWETIAIGELSPDTPSFADTLAGPTVDAFLLDNKHDTHAITARITPPDGSAPFELAFPLHWCRDLEALRPHIRFLPELPAAQSATNWAQIVGFLRAHQPAAPIFFFITPSTTFAELPERRARAEAFLPAFLDALGPLRREIHLIPPLRLAPEMTKLPRDVEHLDLSVYRALAGHVVTICLTR